MTTFHLTIIRQIDELLQFYNSLFLGLSSAERHALSKMDLQNLEEFQANLIGKVTNASYFNEIISDEEFRKMLEEAVGPLPAEIDSNLPF